MNRKKIILISIAVLLLIILGAGAIFLTGERSEENQGVIQDNQGVVGDPIESQPLAPDKEAVKNRLVSSLGEAGVLTENKDFRIEYYSPNLFQVIIKVVNVAEAEDEAINWFKKQGFSEKDICDLPVTFSLTPEVDQKLKGSGFIYNALPDFCR